MAKAHTYLVKFSPAVVVPRGTISIAITQDVGGQHEVEAASFWELKEKVLAIAAEHCKPEPNAMLDSGVSPYIRLKDRKARKPAGFDAWLRGFNFIPYEEKADAV